MSSEIQSVVGSSFKEKRDLLAHLLQEKINQSCVRPSSFAQQRMWFLEQMYPGTPANNIPAAIRMTGSLNIEALRRSFEQIVKRHEALRTTFSDASGDLEQVVTPIERFDLPLTDLSELPEDALQAEANAIIGKHAVQPFDLVAGPLLRVGLLRLREKEHILLLNMHHIISDWWSLSILLRELSVSYESFCAGTTASLRELPIQYGDFSRWQQNQLLGDEVQREISYWSSKLKDAAPVLELPADHVRPAIHSTSGAYEYAMLSKELSDALKTLSDREGVTLFMTLLAAFGTLLHRYTKTSDIIIGTPIAGRNQSETEGVIGFFTNTVVLRLDYSGNPVFRSLLARVRNAALEAYTHQDFPFEKLVEVLRPQRDLSYTPLFQVMFALDYSLVESISLPGLELSSIDVNSGTTKFDLTLFMRATKKGLRVCLQYNTNLFQQDTIKRLVGHFETLLSAIVDGANETVANLPMLPVRERHQLLEEWNDTKADYPYDSCIHQLFELQAGLSPDRIAATFENEQLKYSELNRRSNRLAHYLRSRGVIPEVPVGVYMERSLDMIVELMAILKAGGAYVPLDPDYPPERLAFMIADSGIRMVLTQERLRSGLADDKLEVIAIDSLSDQLSAQSELNPEFEISPANLAYIIYTSGSTGKPKGAMLHHRGICNRLLWGIADYKLGETDRVLSKTPISFDVSVWEIFAPLLAGSRIVIAAPGGEQDSSYLARLIQEQGVTHADFVPSMLHTFLAESNIGYCRSLKRITAAGEPLTVDLQERFFDRLDSELYNLYGPTEASLAVTYWRCRQQPDVRTIPIGKPMGNVQIYILDPYLNQVPVGVQGELHIGGVAVGRGYLNRPDLTADKFIPDSFSGSAGSRLYRTGDLARYRRDGTIEFLGRIDHQVKVRGFRIELGEIEGALANHPSVLEAVVIARQAAGGDSRLVAYVVASEPTPTVSELRNFVRNNLPDFMTPSQFIFLDEMPLTLNGKADRQALPDPDRLRPELEVAYLPPRSRTERRISGIWKEILEVDRVGAEDNFFDLGGHSLLMIRVQRRLKELMDIEVKIVDLFKYSTTRSLAGYLSQQNSGRMQLQSAQQRAQKRERAKNRRTHVRERSKLNG